MGVRGEVLSFSCALVAELGIQRVTERNERHTFD